MKDSQWKRLFQEEMERDAKSILEEVNNDPSVRDVEAPEIIHTRIRQQLNLDDRLTAEERELIRLGKRYKKKRSFTKYVAVAAAAIFILAFSITSTGAGEKIIEKVQWWIADRLQMNLDSHDGSIKGPEIATEDEAYEKIEEVFGVYPVKLDELPKDMVFSKVVIDEELQNARLYYKKGNEKWISCTIIFQHRNASAGLDQEDYVNRTDTMEVQGITVYIIEYDVEDGKARYRAEFEYQKVYYSTLMIGLTEQEMENFVKNLKFF